MTKGTYAKFSQHDDLKKKLLATGDKILAEASPGDTIWGIGCGATSPDARFPHKWKGLNRMGEILMKVRAQLLREQSAATRLRLKAKEESQQKEEATPIPLGEVAVQLAEACHLLDEDDAAGGMKCNRDSDFPKIFRGLLTPLN